MSAPGLRQRRKPSGGPPPSYEDSVRDTAEDTEPSHKDTEPDSKERLGPLADKPNAGNPKKVVHLPNVEGLFLVYTADRDDDIEMLAMRCGTTVEEIRRRNRRVVFDHLDNVHGETIYIPVSKEWADSTGAVFLDDTPEEREQRQKHYQVKAFLELTKGTASRDEALFYLDDSKFEVREAFRAWKHDVDWENEHNDKTAEGKNKMQENVAKAPTSAVVTPQTRSVEIEMPSTRKGCTETAVN